MNKMQWLVKSLMGAMLMIGLVACDSSSSSSSTSDGAVTMAGNWDGEFDSGVEFLMDLKAGDGETFTGSYRTGDVKGNVTGSTSGDNVKMTVTTRTDPPTVAEFSGKVDADRDQMEGKFKIVSGGGGSGTWRAIK